MRTVLTAAAFLVVFTLSVGGLVQLVADERATDFKDACTKRQGYVEMVDNVKLCLRKEPP